MTEMEMVYANYIEAINQIGNLEEAGRDVSKTLLEYAESLKKELERIREKERT